jgi:hypothetical protein
MSSFKKSKMLTATESYIHCIYPIYDVILFMMIKGRLLFDNSTIIGKTNEYKIAQYLVL